MSRSDFAICIQGFGTFFFAENDTEKFSRREASAEEW